MPLIGQAQQKRASFRHGFEGAIDGVEYGYVPADGGYNHFELRRSRRAYSLPGVFNAGDRTPPMEEAEEWVRVNVFY